MGAIRVTNYKSIAQTYANAQKQVAGVADYYYDAAYEIVNLQVFDPELDLLQPFFQAYLSARTTFLQAPASVIGAVGVLQRHILDKARQDDGTVFADINDWIDAAGTNSENTSGAVQFRADETDDTSFQVASEFASLSFQSGFGLGSGNIDTSL